MGIGTITTRAHCLVKDGRAYEGSMADIVAQICNIRWDKRDLYITVGYYPEHRVMSYGDSWTEDELAREAVRDMFRILPRFGFKHYRDIL